MKNWLKNKIIQSLCLHKSTEFVSQITTSIELPRKIKYPRACVKCRHIQEDETDPICEHQAKYKEPKTETTLLYFKRVVNCTDCGKKGLIIKYKA